jgi:hypothetical protein
MVILFFSVSRALPSFKNAANSVKNGLSAHACIFDLTFPILGLTQMVDHCSFAQLL